MAEQLAVESHLRWCRTCTLRVEDLRLIASSLRMGPAGAGLTRTADEAAVAAISEAVVMRVRAEREQSLLVRVRELFTDMRLLWPALGATAAVAICVGAAVTVYRASTATNPESLAAIIDTLATPGSERNPLRPANTRDPLRDQRKGVSIPRLHEDDAMRAGGMLFTLPDEDLIYTVRTVIGRDGRVTAYEMLLANGDPVSPREVSQQRAVLDAVEKSRFAPGQTPMGQAVAVDMVWVLTKATAVVEPAVVRAPAPAPRKDVPKPAEAEPAIPADQRSGWPITSTTA
jgi:hypothetical protein